MLKITIILIVLVIILISLLNRPRKKPGSRWEAIRFVSKKKTSDKPFRSEEKNKTNNQKSRY
ncbi:MAG: hypothetical protein A2252_12265 [Elusimicrobia bacterium RIFOXYA2_FULL_39_19]|nr:MAG: hypothetical protein A2252_12265 [Elusimicrobia bacterium RIFOXYA2_FULL_39_19]